MTEGEFHQQQLEQQEQIQDEVFKYLDTVWKNSSMSYDNYIQLIMRNYEVGFYTAKGMFEAWLDMWWKK